MKALLVNLVAATGLMIAGGAMAAEMPALAKKSGCGGCHAIDKKILGPSWVDVANKYKGQADATAFLSGKISKGSSGVWGAVPMPPQAKLSEAEATELAGFIMGLAN